MKPNPLSSTRLEAALRRSLPAAQPHPELHRSILFAVRSATASGRPDPAFPLRRWVVAAVCVALLALCTRWGFHRPSYAGHSLRDVTLALQGTDNIPEQASVVMVSPLSQELEFLNRDFSNAVKFLVASVP
jgi:hypothetical protein